MRYLDRDFIRERLRLSRTASYRLVGSSRLSLINSDDVLKLLNNARRGGQEVLAYIPSDIRTADEIAAALHDDGDFAITASMIKRWAHRTKNPPPHFHLNQKTLRFRLATFRDWLNAGTRIRSRRKPRA